MGRHANPDIRRAFAEYQDTDSPSKCMKVRCLHCGFTRAKNTTRQIEHLQECQQYLDSPEASAHVSNNDDSELTVDESRAVLNGTHPNPNLQINRRGPNSKRKDPTLMPATARIHHQPPPLPQHQQHHHQQPQPSLTAHLLNTMSVVFNSATQQPFLSHAGCGTLSSQALAVWMVQDGHYTRAYIQFIGALIGKIRLPTGVNSQFHPLYRTMDLLISALNNIRREMSFFEITATKYHINLIEEPPNSVTRSYLDLFFGVSSPSSSLLEGLVVLWATEHVYRSAWRYAQSFTSALSGPSPEPHIAALHQSLIPNWTSPAFSKFVDACRGLVDELAIAPTIANGKEEMTRCEQVFRQVCHLAERFWPSVDSIGGQSGGDQLTLAIGNGNPNHNDNQAFAGVMNGSSTVSGADV